MMINNKIKALEEHNRRLDEQMQSMQQELQDSIAENQKQWQEPTKKAEHSINMQMEAMMATLKSFMAIQRERRNEQLSFWWNNS